MLYRSVDAVSVTHLMSLVAQEVYLYVSVKGKCVVCSDRTCRTDAGVDEYSVTSAGGRPAGRRQPEGASPHNTTSSDEAANTGVSPHILHTAI